MVLWSGKRVESVREKKSDLSSLSMTIYKAKLEMNNFLNFLGRNGKVEIFEMILLVRSIGVLFLIIKNKRVKLGIITAHSSKLH